jgi:hypothetical protein
MPQLNESIIQAAIQGFEAQKMRLDQQIAELRALLPSSTASTIAAEGAPKKRHFSPEAIARMRASQQARWARVRGESQPSTPTPATPQKPKRKLSAAAKAKLAANLKRARAAKAAKAKAAAKTTAPARKKGGAKKAALKPAPAKAAKKAPAVKKTAAKRPVETTPVPTPAPTVAE